MSDAPSRGQFTVFRLMHAMVWLGVALALWTTAASLPVVLREPPPPDIRPVVGCIVAGAVALGASAGAMFGRTFVALVGSTLGIVVAALVLLLL